MMNYQLTGMTFITKIRNKIQDINNKNNLNHPFNKQ